MMTDVPVLIPAFRRQQSLARIIDALTHPGNSMVPKTIVVAHDGPKVPNDVSNLECRSYLNSLRVEGLSVLARERNLGLSMNITDGVRRLASEFGSVIVVEDDLMISPFFYEYMTHQLRQHSSNPDLFSVSGYSFARWSSGQFRTYTLPMISSWGWATWQSAWARHDPKYAVEILDRLSTGTERDLRHRFDVAGSYPYSNLLEAWGRGEVESWAIEWYASQFCASGQSIFPSRSLCAHQRVGEATNRDVPPLAEQRLYMRQPGHLGEALSSSRHATMVRASLRARRIPKPLNLASWLAPFGRG